MHARDSTWICSTTASNSCLSCSGAPSAAARSILPRTRPGGGPWPSWAWCRTPPPVPLHAPPTLAPRGRAVPGAVRAGPLGQPPVLEGPQVSVNRRPPFRQGCPHPGQFGLTTGMLVCLRNTVNTVVPRTAVPPTSTLGTAALSQRKVRASLEIERRPILTIDAPVLHAPRSTSPVYSTAQVRDAAENRVARRLEVARSAASGKSLARGALRGLWHERRRHRPGRPRPQRLHLGCTAVLGRFRVERRADWEASSVMAGAEIGGLGDAGWWRLGAAFERRAGIGRLFRLVWCVGKPRARQGTRCTPRPGPGRGAPGRARRVWQIPQSVLTASR
jgi:hypothetical protein